MPSRTFTRPLKNTLGRKERLRQARCQDTSAEDRAERLAEAQRWARAEQQKQAIRGWFRQQQWFPEGHPVLGKMLRAMEDMAMSEAADRNIIESARNFLLFNEKLRKDGTVAREAPYRTRYVMDPLGVRFDAREALLRAPWERNGKCENRRPAMLAEAGTSPSTRSCTGEKPF